MRKIRLFCFPYAGGSAAVFSKWARYLDPSIELIPVELAGRGRRMHEALQKDISAVVDDVFAQLKDKIIFSRYALFGHSLGSAISYLLAQKIRDHRLPAPEHIFFSGRSAPHVKRVDEKIFYLMDDQDFRKEVIALGGTPPEFFEHPALMEFFLPMLKNDFRLAEADIHQGQIHPLDNPITVFLGKEDDLTAEQCDGWKEHTKRHCFLYYFDGGHFFIHSETEKIAAIINSVLK